MFMQVWLSKIRVALEVNPGPLEPKGATEYKPLNELSIG